MIGIGINEFVHLGTDTKVNEKGIKYYILEGYLYYILKDKDGKEIHIRVKEVEL